MSSHELLYFYCFQCVILHKIMSIVIHIGITTYMDVAMRNRMTARPGHLLLGQV